MIYIPIYTRIGDDGLTYVPLFGNAKIPKNHLILEVLGTIDELSSVIGLARSFLRSDEDLRAFDNSLKRIQERLFSIGLIIAGTGKGLISEGDVGWLEKEIDRLSKDLTTNVFIIPTGHVVASVLHVARTICRRLERRVVSLKNELPNIVSEVMVKYINRLSDYLYILALHVNKLKGIEEERIKP